MRQERLTDTKARYHAHSNIHCNVNAPSLQSATEHSQQRSSEEPKSPPVPVGKRDAGKGSDESTCLKDSVDCARKVGGVGPLVEFKALNEGRLSKSRPNDAGGIRVGQTAQGDEEYPLVAFVNVWSLAF